MIVKEYIKEFEKLGLGMFVHFGLYSILGKGEWAKCSLEIPEGDSITDAGRSREDDSHLGYGYATRVKEELELQYPNEYTMYNRGVSGNHVVDLYARIKTDIINLKPDYMSILIGVNDVWHAFDGQENGVDAEKYGLIFVALQEKFDEVLKEAPSEYWLLDGVHPLLPGNEIIKREWMKGFNKLLSEK